MWPSLWLAGELLWEGAFFWKIQKIKCGASSFFGLGCDSLGLPLLGSNLTLVDIDCLNGSVVDRLPLLLLNFCRYRLLLASTMKVHVGGSMVRPWIIYRKDICWLTIVDYFPLIRNWFHSRTSSHTSCLSWTHISKMEEHVPVGPTYWYLKIMKMFSILHACPAIITLGIEVFTFNDWVWLMLMVLAAEQWSASSSSLLCISEHVSTKRPTSLTNWRSFRCSLLMGCLSDPRFMVNYTYKQGSRRRGTVALLVKNIFDSL